MGEVKLEQVEVLLQRLANQIEPQLPRGWGFFLWMASFGEGGFCTHITNVDPDGMVAALSEWLERVRTDGFSNLDVAAGCWTCGRKVELLTFEGPKRSVAICADCASTCARRQTSPEKPASPS